MNRALFLIGALMLSGCGLHPLYGGGSSGAVAGTMGQVEVAPIEGKAGWLMANALRDHLGEGGHGASRYRLDVRLNDQLTGLGVRPDNSVSRERRALRARFQLVDVASGATVIDDTAGADAGIDVVRSEYATVAAENSALERLTGIVADKIVARLALYAHRATAARP